MYFWPNFPTPHIWRQSSHLQHYSCLLSRDWDLNLGPAFCLVHNAGLLSSSFQHFVLETVTEQKFPFYQPDERSNIMLESMLKVMEVEIIQAGIMGSRAQFEEFEV